MEEKERLEKGVRLQQKWMQQERERAKKTPNENMDDDLPPSLPRYPFWCDECQEDLGLPCRKASFTFEGKRVSVMSARCPDCERRLLRFVTHRDLDPFYQKSRKLQRERNKNAVDLLQADQYGFKTSYGDQFKKSGEDLKLQEKAIWDRDRQVGLRGLSLENKERLKKLYGL